MTNISMLPDTQNQLDKRGLRLPKVGVSNVHFLLHDPKIPAVADMYVSLKATAKGINMSRLGEALLEVNSRNHEEISDLLRETLEELSKRLDAQNAYVKIKFELLLEKEAPISKKVGYTSYQVTFEGTRKKRRNKYYLSVRVPYISCCSCSKALSEHLEGSNKKGAPHNQRSYADVTIELDSSNEIRIESLITLVENAVQTLPYPVIKRTDEQEVARRSWAFTQFCEDSSRNIALAIKDDTRVKDYVVVVRHLESIHQHDAVAIIHKGKRGGLR